MSSTQEPAARLLIVDDEKSVRSALRRALRKEGYQIFFAESAMEALDILKEHGNDIDLILSDHLMPKMTGLELLKRCRLLYPDIGRVVLTGQAEMDTVIGAINDGEVFRFLRKPWDDDEVKLTIHLAVRQSRLEKENRRLLHLLKDQAKQIQSLERKHPGISSIQRDATGAILIDDEELAAP